MAESRLPAAIDYLVGVFTNSSALQALNVVTWDGPPVSEDYRDAVFVGYDAGGTDSSEFQAATIAQKWAGIGQRKRDEETQITCAVVVTMGDPGWKPVRDRAFAILEAVGQILRADPSLGLTPPADYSIAEMWPGDYFQIAEENGWQAVLQFVVHHKTRV